MADFARAHNPAQVQAQAAQAPGRALVPLAREHPLLARQQAVGNQAVQQMLRAADVQAKLTVSQPGDPYEEEADRVAEHVMRMPATGEVPQIQRKCAQCEEEEHKLQAKEMPGEAPAPGQGAGARVAALRGGGEPLRPSLRAWFEPRFGRDFGNVRIHTGRAAAEAARSIRALAYTDGANIVFGRGQYAPETPEGRRLLAHELVHTIQQTGGDQVRRTIGDGHDLASPRFAGDPVLEACYDNEKALRYGARGPAVEKVQQALVDAGFPLPEYGVDGIYGSETIRAVKQYQEAAGLTADGVMGTKTIGEMDRNQPSLPECPVTTVPAGGMAFRGAPLLANLRGLTCQLKGLTDAAALARIQSVTVTAKGDDIVRQRGTSNVQVVTQLKASGSAKLAAGSENANYTFGFVQLCRPFDVARATYLQSGAQPGANNMLNFDASMNIRSGPPPLPAFDHAGPWCFGVNAKGTANVEAKGTPDNAGTLAAIPYQDTPSTVFPIDVEKNNVFYTISGIAAQSFFFTAFVVKLPSGTVVPLRTFYWDMKYCEALPAGVSTALKTPKTAGKANVAPVRNCQTSSCDRTEPGFDKAGKTTPAGETCLALTLAAFQKTNLDGPSQFDIGCAK